MSYMLAKVICMLTEVPLKKHDREIRKVAFAETLSEPVVSVTNGAYKCEIFWQQKA